MQFTRSTCYLTYTLLLHFPASPVLLTACSQRWYRSPGQCRSQVCQHNAAAAGFRHPSRGHHLGAAGNKAGILTAPPPPITTLGTVIQYATGPQRMAALPFTHWITNFQPIKQCSNSSLHLTGLLGALPEPVTSTQPAQSQTSKARSFPASRVRAKGLTRSE